MLSAAIGDKRTAFAQTLKLGAMRAGAAEEKAGISSQVRKSLDEWPARIIGQSTIQKAQWLIDEFCKEEHFPHSLEKRITFAIDCASVCAGASARRCPYGDQCKKNGFHDGENSSIKLLSLCSSWSILRPRPAVNNHHVAQPMHSRSGQTSH